MGAVGWVGIGGFWMEGMNLMGYVMVLFRGGDVYTAIYDIAE